VRTSSAVYLVQRHQGDRKLTTGILVSGVSGPFWYASGATVQIILFATLAIELKRRAPNAHTCK